MTRTVTPKRRTKATYKPTGHTRAYYDCPKKQEARRFIAECWRGFAGRTDIPSDRDYYTLCGPMAAKDGVLSAGSEIRQLVEVEGLFRPGQFVGVEWKQSTHDSNEVARDLAYPASTWPRLYHGDIVDVLLEHQYEGRLAASIVYLDTANEARAAIQLLRSVLNVLNHIDGPTMVVWNVISERLSPRNVSYPWDAHDDDACVTFGGYIRDFLMQDRLFQEYYRHGWDMYPEHPTLFHGLRYESTTATQMSTYVFGRRQRACRDGCACPR